jgi:hypothetical protein
MIFRASARFQKHYRQKAEKVHLPAQRFPLAWNLDILPHGRSQLIVLASEECSLFSFFIPLTRSTDFSLFLAAFQHRLTGFMEHIQLSDRPDISGYRLGRRVDRSLIGSQNDFLFVASAMFLDFEKPISPANLNIVEREINCMPMSYLGMNSPDRAIWRLSR